MGEHITTLESEASRATELLAGKAISLIRRPALGTIVVEFDDGTRLFVDSKGTSLELSITGDNVGLSPATTTVYVELLDEGVDTWRPVEAVEVSSGRYLLGGSVPELERWAFQPGSVVECEVRKLSEGPALVATRLVRK
jgi:hypothetical protein